jgi:hypothetical protein
MKRIVLILPFVLIGCSQTKPPVPVHPVSGQVMYNGKAAVGVQVYLYPTSAPMVPEIPANPHGVTGTDGRFQLTTYSPEDGAAEGGYQIVLLWPAQTSEEDEESNSDRLLGWYDAVRSKLTATVKPGDNVLPTIQIPAITRPPEVLVGVPGRN